MEKSWRIELLGGLRVESGGRFVTRFPTQKAAALLAYLAYHRDRPHARDVLTALLWPDAEPEASRHRLNVALSSLRRQLALPGTGAGAPIVSDRLAVQLDPTLVTTDTGEFEAAIRDGWSSPPADPRSPAEIAEGLTRAIDLYRGALLPGLYEDWIAAEQQRLETLFFQALPPLIALLEQAGERDRALRYALRGVSVDPLREEAHREVIRLHLAAGQPAAALRQYHDLERRLRQELDTAPSAATRQLLEANEPWGVQVFRSSGVHETNDQQPTTHTTTGIGPTPEHLNTRTPEHRPPAVSLEPAGGAVPLDSPFYVERAADHEFAAALARQDSIVLVKGPRQVGKTSLLARGLRKARRDGARVVVTDLERLNTVELASAETLLLALAQGIVDALDLEVSPRERWTSQRGPNANFQRFLEREVLRAVDAPLVWALDEVDCLFGRPFAGEVFGLFRSWHNARTLDPDGPWSAFTLAIAYATEAHLFITDLNKSPFNVGTRLTLEDFTPEQVAKLNRCSGNPLTDDGELVRYYDLLGGHPYLVRRGLHELVTRGIGLAVLESRAVNDDFVFGDHLQRMATALTRDTELCEAMRAILGGKPCPSLETFYRLRTAGLVAADPAPSARPRCRLYAAYLTRRLGVGEG